MRNASLSIAFALPLLLAACGGGSTNLASDDDVGEDVDSTPDGQNSAYSWADCSYRLQFLPDPAPDEPHPKDLERCVFAPSTAPVPDQQAECVWCGWPAPPWPKAIPQIGFVEQMYQPELFLQYSRSWAAADGDWSKLRSGLIGNFAFYYDAATGSTDVPTTHPRPPIVTGKLEDQVAIDKLHGLYNAFGTPCSTVNSALEFGVPRNLDCHAHLESAGVQPISQSLPLVGGDLDYARKASVCLDNEMQYEFEVAFGVPALLKARNGLTWVNLAKYPALLDAIESGSYSTPAIAAAFAALTPWLALSEWGSPPDQETQWDYSMWSYTGVCAFKAQIEAIELEWGSTEKKYVTSRACPKTHTAVLPPFDLESLALGGTVNGFCALPFWQPVMPLPEDPQPSVQQLDLASTGYYRGFHVDLDAVDRLLTTALGGFTLASLAEGWSIEISTSAAAETFALLGIEDGDVLSAIDSDLDLRGAPVTEEIGSEVARRLLTGSILTLWIERDGWTLPTYVIPVFVPTSETPKDTTSDSSDSTGTTSEG